MIGRKLIKSSYKMITDKKNLLAREIAEDEEVKVFVYIEIEILDKYITQGGTTNYIFKELSFIEKEVFIEGRNAYYNRVLPFEEIKDKISLKKGLSYMSGDWLVKNCFLKEETK